MRPGDDELDDPAVRPDDAWERAELAQNERDRYGGQPRRCVFAGVDGHRCSGSPQWHHPIKQQRLRRRFPRGAYWSPSERVWRPIEKWSSGQLTDLGYKIRLLRVILEDERNRIWACWDAHQRVEGDYSRLPERVWEFAREFGLEGMLRNDIDRQGVAALRDTDERNR